MAKKSKETDYFHDVTKMTLTIVIAGMILMITSKIIEKVTGEKIPFFLPPPTLPTYAPPGYQPPNQGYYYK